MKKAWDEKTGIVEVWENGELEEYAWYKHGYLYFTVMKDTKTGELINGWNTEYTIDEILELSGKTREDYVEIPLEEVLKIYHEQREKESPKRG